jgi:flagellar biosynthesis/type III secretory pathway chaperone
MACKINGMVYVSSAEARIITGESATSVMNSINKLIYTDCVNMNDFEFAKDILKDAGVLSDEMEMRIKKITEKTRTTWLIPIDQVIAKAKKMNLRNEKIIELKLKRIQEAITLVKSLDEKQI